MSDKRVTIEQVMSWHPCGYDRCDDWRNYTRARVERLFAGRETLGPGEIAALDIDAADRYWALLHLLTEKQRHELACRVAEDILPLINDDLFGTWVIEAKRAWLRDEIDDKQLNLAANAAKDAQAHTPTWASAYAIKTISAAIGSVPSVAAWLTACDASWAIAQSNADGWDIVDARATAWERYVALALEMLEGAR